MTVRAFLLSATFAFGGSTPLWATTISPPLLDISKQCEAGARHNVTAMSECIVAESEARAELLQNWSKYSDSAADKCIKASRKVHKLPYTAMAKCMAAEAPTSSKVGTATDRK